MSAKYKQYVNARERFFCNSVDLYPDDTIVPATLWVSRKSAYKKESTCIQILLIEAPKTWWDIDNAINVKITPERELVTASNVSVRRPILWERLQIFVDANFELLNEKWNDVEYHLDDIATRDRIKQNA